LQTDSDAVEIEYRLPILSQDVQTDVSFQIDVWVIDLRGYGLSKLEES
jgi:hypothetical protein